MGAVISYCGRDVKKYKDPEALVYARFGRVLLRLRRTLPTGHSNKMIEELSALVVKYSVLSILSRCHEPCEDAEELKEDVVAMSSVGLPEEEASVETLYYSPDNVGL